MNLNSYLNDFFGMLHNSITGGNNMYGGIPKSTELTFLDTDTNKQILDHYFENVPDVVTIDSILKLKDNKKKEFKDNQVMIVKYMLENPNMKSDDKETSAVAAAHLVNRLEKQSLNPLEECGLLTKYKNQTDFISDDFNFNDDYAFDKCFEQINSYIMISKKSRNDRTDIVLLMNGTVLDKTKNPGKRRTDMVLLLNGLVF